MTEIQKIHKEMLFPTVSVRTADNYSGSGTIICSRVIQNKIKTFVLTNYHVIESTIKIIEKWDSLEKEKIDTEIQDGCFVEITNYDKNLNVQSVSSYPADAIGFGDRKTGTDYALLMINNCDRIMPVAPINKKFGINSVYVGEEVWTIGAPNGVFPTLTKGIIGNKGVRFDGCDQMLVTSPIFYGSSGGPVFKYFEKENRYCLIGMITTGVRDQTVEQHKDSKQEPLIPHLAYAVSVDKIYKWLIENGLGFIFKKDTVKK